MRANDPRADVVVRLVKQSKEHTLSIWERACEILDDLGSLEAQLEDYPDEEEEDDSRDIRRGRPSQPR